MNDKAPGRRVGQPDNKASHYYLALYLAKTLTENGFKSLQR